MATSQGFHPDNARMVSMQFLQHLLAQFGRYNHCSPPENQSPSTVNSSLLCQNGHKASDTSLGYRFLLQCNTLLSMGSVRVAAVTSVA